MSFRAITIAPGQHHEPVLISVRNDRGRHRIRLTFHPDFLGQIGWTESTLLQPFVGEGPDEGKVMIKPVSSGRRGLKLSKVSHSTRLFIQFIPPAGAPDKFAAVQPDAIPNTMEKSLTIRLPWSDKGTQRRAAE